MNTWGTIGLHVDTMKRLRSYRENLIVERKSNITWDDLINHLMDLIEKPKETV